MFRDPQLNALEEQAGQANQTLKIAEANFREAERQSSTTDRFNIRQWVRGRRLPATVYQLIARRLLRPRLWQFCFPINVSYDADFWGRVRRTMAQAREQFQASAADLENVKLELQTELAVDYFDARSLDSQKRLLDDTVVAYQKALTLTQNRFNGGVASKAEVAQAQTQLDQTEAQESKSAVARAQFEHAIAVLTGGCRKV